MILAISHPHSMATSPSDKNDESTKRIYIKSQNKHEFSNKSEEKDLPMKWREGISIESEYAFSAISGAWNLAPPMIIIKFIFGTFVNATPYKFNQNRKIKNHKQRNKKKSSKQLIFHPQIPQWNQPFSADQEAHRSRSLPAATNIPQTQRINRNISWTRKG